MNRHWLVAAHAWIKTALARPDDNDRRPKRARPRRGRGTVDRHEERSYGRIRPAMVFGVTQAWLVIELLLPFILFLMAKSFWPFLLFPVMHLIGFVGLAIDKRFVEVEMAR